MAFKRKKRENNTFESPQQMFRDHYKRKGINGILDYQSEMIDQYMDHIDDADIALEMPTGSGKTLIGLLIGEYRRRMNKERVVFVCLSL